MAPNEGTVFVVDDDSSTRELLSWLMKRNGLHAEVFPDAYSFLKGYKRGASGCLVVDLNMPGVSGPESLGALVEAFAGVSIIVMSGSEAKEDVLGCLSVGVNGYIPKSLPVPDMVAAIRQVLEGGMFVPRGLARWWSIFWEAATAMAQHFGWKR